MPLLPLPKRFLIIQVVLVFALLLAFYLAFYGPYSITQVSAEYFGTGSTSVTNLRFYGTHLDGGNEIYDGVILGGSWDSTGKVIPVPPDSPLEIVIDGRRYGLRELTPQVIVAMGAVADQNAGGMTLHRGAASITICHEGGQLTTVSCVANQPEGTRAVAVCWRGSDPIHLPISRTQLVQQLGEPFRSQRLRWWELP